jgi:hypothetical protein
MMPSSDTIHLRIARVLRLSAYLALILILFSIILKSLNLPVAVYAAAAGIGLIIASPLLGVIAAAVIALKIRNLKFFFAAVSILLIFIITFLAGL